MKKTTPYLPGILRLASAALLLCFAHAAYIIYDGLTDELAPADAIVVFGCRVYPDGTPSRRLKGRLDRGYELYKQGLSRTLVVTGGRGRHGQIEAPAMAAYLEKRGVPRADILVDSVSADTWESARTFKRLAEEKGFRSAILVSQYFHLTRAKLLFRRAGFRTVYASHARIPPELRELYSVPREVASFYYSLARSLRGSPTAALPASPNP